jgi:hypothetical protein
VHDLHRLGFVEIDADAGLKGLGREVVEASMRKGAALAHALQIFDGMSRPEHERPRRNSGAGRAPPVCSRA